MRSEWPLREVGQPLVGMASLRKHVGKCMWMQICQEIMPADANGLLSLYINLGSISQFFETIFRFLARVWSSRCLDLNVHPSQHPLSIYITKKMDKRL